MSARPSQYRFARMDGFSPFALASFEGAERRRASAVDFSCSASLRTKPRCGVGSSSGFPGETTERHDHVALRSAEPYPTEVVTRARNRDSAVRTATSLLSLTTCDHLDKKHIPVRGADASEFSAAVELGVIGLASGSGEGEHDVQFRFAADLSDLAGPSPCDCGRRGRGSGSRRRFCTW